MVIGMAVMTMAKCAPIAVINSIATVEKGVFAMVKER
jgi:hypothetical protein